MSSIATNRRPATGSRRIFSAASAIILALVLAGSELFAVACAAPATAHYKVPMEPFMQDLMKASVADHFTLGGNLVVPTIWLYSPAGKLTTVANSDASLDAMTRKFPPDKATAPTNQASLSDLLSVLAKSSGKASDSTSAMRASKWTAVLFTMNSPQCHHCEEFGQAARKFTAALADKLNSVTVTLKMP